MHKLYTTKELYTKTKNRFILQRIKIFIQQTYVAKNMTVCLYANFIHITFMRKSYNQHFPQNFVANKSERKKVMQNNYSQKEVT